RRAGAPSRGGAREPQRVLRAVAAAAQWRAAALVRARPDGASGGARGPAPADAARRRAGGRRAVRGPVAAGRPAGDRGSAHGAAREGVMPDSVLLIDDDADLLRAVGDYFDRIGYEVGRADTAQA